MFTHLDPVIVLLYIIVLFHFLLRLSEKYTDKVIWIMNIFITNKYN